MLHGQEKIEFNSISEFEQEAAHRKVILISADWCRICPTAEKTITESKELANELNGSVTFFKIENTFDETLNFKNKDYKYIQTGLKEGYHEFVKYLIGDQEVTYPTWKTASASNNGLRKCGKILRLLPSAYVEATLDLRCW